MTPEVEGLVGRANQMLADRGRFPSGGDVPFDVAVSLIAAALSASVQEPGWRTMESAPRDGSYILVSGPDCGCEIVTWQLETWIDQAGMTQGNWPTHWQHLPAAPSANAGGEG